MGVLTRGCRVSPKFSRPLAAKLYVGAPTVFEVQERILEVLYHRAKFGGAWISSAAGAAKNGEFFVCYRQHCEQCNARVYKLLRGRF